MVQRQSTTAWGGATRHASPPDETPHPLLPRSWRGSSVQVLSVLNSNIKSSPPPQYFDELRGLLPYGGDSAKFDKNAILHHSILLIKQLIQELEVEEAAGSFKP